LDLHSDTELYLDEGAVLLGSESPIDYLPKIKSRFEGSEMECYRSLINIGTLNRKEYTIKNVTVRGKGAIYGGGAALSKATIEREREALKKHLLENADYVKTCENEDTIPGRARGRLINISSCDGALIAGLSLGYGASWNVHFIYSKNITTYGCSISSRGVWNGDGWDPDSSEDAVIFDTTFDTHDNAIAIKSGKNPEGNQIGIPTRNIRIFDCRGRNDIAIGSELSGGIDGVYVRDCCFLNSWGINIKTTADRGGYIRNVDVRDSELSSVTVRTRVNFNNDNTPAGYLTDIQGLRFENLTLQGVFMNANDERTLISPISIDGFDDKDAKIRDVTFKGIKILPREDGEMQTIKCRNVTNLSLEDIEFF
jgi:polygalacturonase